MKNSQRQACTTRIEPATAAPLKLPFDLFTTMIEFLINIPTMNAVWRERRELESLTDEHIKDMGLTPDSVRQELKRSYFDIPCERRRAWKARPKTQGTRTF